MTYTRTYRRRYSRRSGPGSSKLMWVAVIVGALLLAGHAKDHGGTAVTTSAPAGAIISTAQARTEQAYAQRTGGYSDAQETCLDELWTEESGWSPYAANSHSDARGIPQDINGWSDFAPGDWKAQVRWGVRYIAQRYHADPCTAWTFERSHTPNWY
jgi:peptidoglycan DL-endopeptidase CwlO